MLPNELLNQVADNLKHRAIFLHSKFYILTSNFYF